MLDEGDYEVRYTLKDGRKGSIRARVGSILSKSEAEQLKTSLLEQGVSQFSTNGDSLDVVYIPIASAEVVPVAIKD